MAEIKRLHKVHYQYPDVPKRGGKSTYCYDSLLRIAQTGYYKNICYMTNTYKVAMCSLNDFMEFLENEEEVFTVSSVGVVTLYNTEITFTGMSNKSSNFDAVVEDFYY